MPKNRKFILYFIAALTKVLEGYYELGYYKQFYSSNHVSLKTN
jgi:hypothetical protein